MRPWLACLALAVLASSGCGGGSGSADARVVPDGETVECSDDPRALTYVANLERPGDGGTFRFILEQGSPAPPGRGTNTWTVKVTDLDGAVVPGASLAVRPFMPDHGHGTSVVPQVSPGPADDFTVDVLYLFMPGIWEITLTATAGTTSDRTTFTFCVEG